MKWVLLILTHLWAFVIGIHVAEWSAKEDHATMHAAGKWLRSWFVKDDRDNHPTGEQG